VESEGVMDDFTSEGDELESSVQIDYGISRVLPTEKRSSIGSLDGRI
jgi:hypothetical protein